MELVFVIGDEVVVKKTKETKVIEHIETIGGIDIIYCNDNTSYHVGQITHPDEVIKMKNTVNSFFDIMEGNFSMNEEGLKSLRREFEEKYKYEKECLQGKHGVAKYLNTKISKYKEYIQYYLRKLFKVRR